MKRIIPLILPVTIILTGCFLAGVAIFSTGYKAEKLFYQAWVGYNLINQNPQAAAPEDYQKVKALMQEIVKKYPNAGEAAQSQYLLAQMAFFNGDASTAREEYRKVVNNYPGHGHLASEAQFMLARTYEEDDPERAVEEYSKISLQYPGTLKAFQAPIHIAEFYKQLNQPKKSEKAYDEAIKGYQKFARETNLPETGQIARYYVALANGSRGNLDEAIEALEALLAEDAASVNQLQLKFTLAGFYYDRGRYEDSRELYQEVIDKVPGTLMGKLAERRLKALDSK